MFNSIHPNKCLIKINLEKVHVNYDNRHLEKVEIKAQTLTEFYLFNSSFTLLGFPEYISSEFPYLKSLYVCLSKNMKKINLLSHKLDNLTLSDMPDFDEAIIDTPNLQSFELLNMEKVPRLCHVVGSRQMEVEIGLKNARTTNSTVELITFAKNLGRNITPSFDTSELKVLLDELKGQKTYRNRHYKCSDYICWCKCLGKL
ncbi:hypothetical protein R3W88_014590 [Solanum pinnatisectum]|uniref:Uncharacterized protein n=1 Tax=Solanum pinnatisectum TaxID=50273 RepID=A0AAV9KTB0_9SOLN|nr:hypothetical protein R3W88_014590 [Solanum pinnatisectum]